MTMTPEHKQKLRDAALRRLKFEKDFPKLMHEYKKQSLEQRRKEWREVQRRQAYRKQRHEDREVSRALRAALDAQEVERERREEEHVRRTGHHTEAWIWCQKNKAWQRGGLTKKQYVWLQKREEQSKILLEADKQLLRTRKNPLHEQTEAQKKGLREWNSRPRG